MKSRFPPPSPGFCNVKGARPDEAANAAAAFGFGPNAPMQPKRMPGHGVSGNGMMGMQPGMQHPMMVMGMMPGGIPGQMVPQMVPQMGQMVPQAQAARYW